MGGNNHIVAHIAALEPTGAAILKTQAMDHATTQKPVMGGRVGLEVARLLPEIVTGVIGVDTLQDADQEMDPEEVNAMLAGFEADFPATCGGFVRSMFGEQASEILIQEVATDMCGGPAVVGTSNSER